MQINLKVQNNHEEYKETELGLLPEEWEVVRLGDVAEKMKAGGTPRTNIKEYWGNDDVPLVKVEDVVNSDKFLAKTNLSITKDGLDHSSAWLVPENSIILSMYGTPGEVCINKVPVAVTQNVMGIIKNDKVTTEFLYYALKYAKKYTLHLITDRTIFSHFSLAKAKKLIFPLPPIDEQKSIAFVLSTIQAAKEKTEQVIQATKEFKKSLMKHLFTYGPVSLEEAEKVKLKETEIGLMPKEWEVVKLKNVFSIFAGGDVSKINYSPIKTGKFIYPIYSNSKENNGLYGFSDTFKAPENSITITGRGNLGYAVPRYEKFNAIIRLLVLTPKNHLNIKFVSEYINAKIRINLEGSSIPQLTVPKISSYLIPLPPLPIQQKIAEILSTVDEKIQAEENKKKALEELFKSMLHNLMTAKIRVKDLVIEDV
jgi:type I restriction enzyme S subunit